MLRLPLEQAVGDATAKLPSMMKLMVRITYEIKPGIFDEKRGNAALLIKNSGFYFIFIP